MSQHLEIKNEISEELLSESILFAFKNSISSNNLTILLLKCILSFISNEKFQEQALKTDLNSMILNGLYSTSVALKSALNNFIISTTVYPKFAEEYINRGVLEYLIGNEKKFSIICINWSTTIESILRSNLSIKCAYRNKLEFNEAIENGFYVSRKPFNDFKILRNIMNEDCSPRFPVYFIHFNNQISESVENSKISTDSCDFCYSKRPLDVELPEYVARIQEKFNEICSDNDSEIKRICLIKMKYKIIAELVCKEISSERKHTVDFHLDDLKVITL